MRLLVVLIALALTAGTATAQVQDLGHRLPGGVGFDAGTQNDPGLYAGYRFAWFSSHTVHDRNGDVVPIENLDLDAYAHNFGISGTVEVGDLYVSAALSVPVVKKSLSADRPEASIDRLGLGNVYVEPLRLGARFGHADTIASYSFYAPTSQGAKASVGRPEWAHQISAGGTLFLDDRRGWRISLLASYLHNLEKQGIEITRGDTFQLQGGAGGRIFGPVEVGVAGYAVWQVTDDSGRDLPAILRGARDRAFGLGPELDVRIPALRSRVFGRLEWDLDGEARPVGSILVLGISTQAWR